MDGEGAMTPAELLAFLKGAAKARGYRIDREETATEIIERLIRPDGTLAMIARKPKEEVAR